MSNFYIAAWRCKRALMRRKSERIEVCWTPIVWAMIAWAIVMLANQLVTR